MEGFLSPASSARLLVHGGRGVRALRWRRAVVLQLARGRLLLALARAMAATTSVWGVSCVLQ